MEWFYIIAASLFVVGLKMLSSPETARHGNLVSAVGMLLAIVATLQGRMSFSWIMAGFLIGSAAGAISAYRGRWCCWTAIACRLRTRMAPSTWISCRRC